LGVLWGRPGRVVGIGGDPARGEVVHHGVGGLPHTRERSLMILALFQPRDELTAIFYLAAVIVFIVAAFASGVGKRTGGQTGLVAIGLALWLFPTMWQTMDAAF